MSSSDASLGVGSDNEVRPININTGHSWSTSSDLDSRLNSEDKMRRRSVTGGESPATSILWIKN